MCRDTLDFSQIEQRHDIDFPTYFGESLERLHGVAATVWCD